MPSCLIGTGPLPTASIVTTQPRTRSIEIPPDLDPFLVDGGRIQRQRLAQLSSAQRAALVLERYPELRALPSCDWQRLSVQASFSVLFGESARHYAQLELAALAGVLASAGVSTAYAKELEIAARRVLELLRQAFGIATPRAITLDVWEAWGRDTDLMRTLTDRVGKYAAAVNLSPGRLPRTAQPRGPGACWPPAAAATAEAVPSAVRAQRRAAGRGSTQP